MVFADIEVYELRLAILIVRSDWMQGRTVRLTAEAAGGLLQHCTPATRESRATATDAEERIRWKGNARLLAVQFWLGAMIWW